MGKLAIIALVLCASCTSYASDLCRAFHPKAECRASCPEADGSILYDEATFLCASGLCCEGPPEQPGPNSTADDTTFVVDSDTCGVVGSRISKRAIGREVSAACTWPWLVSITAHNETITRSHLLNGILVSGNAVLVHKQTFDGFANWNGLTIEAVIGEYYLNMVGDERQIYSIDVNAALEIGDFRLLILGEEVQVDSCVRPVCLSNVIERDSLDMDQCKMIGWGVTETGTGGHALVPVPLQTSVTIDSPFFCGRLFDLIPENYDSSKDLCLKMEPGITVTDGDRGSAVICPGENQQWHLKAIVTKGSVKFGEASIGPFAVDVTSVADSIRQLLP